MAGHVGAETAWLGVELEKHHAGASVTPIGSRRPTTRAGNLPSSPSRPSSPPSASAASGPARPGVPCLVAILHRAQRDLDAFAQGGWTPPTAQLQTADKMHSLLAERADSLMGCTEGGLRFAYGLISTRQRRENPVAQRLTDAATREIYSKEEERRRRDAGSEPRHGERTEHHQGTARCNRPQGLDCIAASLLLALFAGIGLLAFVSHLRG